MDEEAGNTRDRVMLQCNEWFVSLDLVGLEGVSLVNFI